MRAIPRIRVKQVLVCVCPPPPLPFPHTHTLRGENGGVTYARYIYFHFYLVMSPKFPLLHVLEKKVHCVKANRMHTPIKTATSMAFLTGALLLATFFECYVSWIIVFLFSAPCGDFSSSSDDLNDSSKPISSRRYTPSRLQTQLSTVHSQFLIHVAISPHGQYAIIMTSFDIPCSLWPVVVTWTYT